MAEAILIPLDGSELAERALAPARRLLGADGEAVLVRVVEETPPSEEEDALDAAEAYLKDVRTRLEGAGARVRATLVRRGDPAEQVLAAVDESGAAFVAMGTHGRSGVARLVRGSVAERVLRHCPVPLLLVNPHAAPAATGTFERILAPLDGSETAAAVLPTVARVAKAFGALVTLLRVEPFLYSPVPSPVLESMWEPAKVAATLEPSRQRLEEQGVEARVEARYGVESAEILAAAEYSDLVVMSTHGRSGLSRWWFGSVAEQVLRHCSRPLLVQRVTGS